MEDKRAFVNMLMNANMDFQVCGDDVAVPFPNLGTTIIFQFGTKGLFGTVNCPSHFTSRDEEDEEDA